MTCSHPAADSEHPWLSGMYRERNGTDFHWKLWPGTVRNGTDDVSERNGREWNGTDFFSERNGTDFCSGRSGTEPNPQMSTPIQTMVSSQKRSHRNSGQNRPIERSTALMGTIFMTISVFKSRGHFWATFGQHLGNTIFHGTDRTGFFLFRTERNSFYGTDSFLERNGTDFTERIFCLERNGTERFIPALGF